eukprot:GEMP01126989.1.p1 GENE.GEMP01126989.1~~GEMP01126989.1.p1  ORF type:complete len:132 (+),score=20.92 GEMP01126989.1:102-497(+)
MASLGELKDALANALEHRGVLGKIKAQIQNEIFDSLDDPTVQRPPLPPENVIINELIREYLEYNQYNHALSVFLAESGHPDEKPFPREFLARELKLEGDLRAMSMPLLYGLIGSIGDTTDPFNVPAEIQHS